MERLTEKCWRNLDPWEMCGQDHFCTRGCHDLGGCTGGCIVPKVYARLAAYEDTGLTPEEIRELKGLWKVVCELYVINTVGLSINDPLTLEELHKMDGEPLWYESLTEKHGEYFILRVINGIYLAQGGGSNKCAVNAATYGKAWLAYRRRPEEKMQ